MTSNFIWQESITKISAPYICFYFYVLKTSSQRPRTPPYFCCATSQN